MALVTRYFSTSDGPDGNDGTTWAKRATLFAGSAWSSIITGFSFAGSDALQCRIGPGSYSISAALSASPTVANGLYLHGCDSSGNLLSPPAAGWTSDQPAWDDSTLPSLVNTLANGVYLNSAAIRCRLLKLSGSTLNSLCVCNGDWLSIVDSGSHSSVFAISAAYLSNSVVRMTGSAYDAAIKTNGTLSNVRIVGNSSATSGSRRGVVCSSYSAALTAARLCIINSIGSAIELASSIAFALRISRSVIATCGTGLVLPSPGEGSCVDATGLCITGCTTGISGALGGLVITNSRLRNTTDLSATGNAPQYDLYEIAGTDAEDYADAAAGDYRIKAAAGFANRGIGVSQVVDSGSSLRTGMF